MQKTKTLIAAIILATLIIPIVAQTAYAADNIQLPGYLKVYAAPNPTGVGQTVFVSLFFTKPIPVNGSSSGATLYEGLTVTITAPDGTNTTMGPYTSDTTGGVGGIEFTPTAVGNYSVQAYYPGQIVAGGYEVMPTKSEPYYFIVQTEQISGIVSPPLPTEYWSRPIYSTNYGWSVLGGAWFGAGRGNFAETGGYDASNNNYNPYSTAPNAPHIMWVKPNSLGGQVGGPISGDQESQYTSTSIAYQQFEPIILNGVIYYKMYPNIPTSTSSSNAPGITAVDLRTGQTLWTLANNKNTPIFAFVVQYHTIQEYGTQAWLVCAASSGWVLYDPTTGTQVGTISGAPSSSSFGPTTGGLIETNDNNLQGSVYVVSQPSNNQSALQMWNSSKCLFGTGSDQRTLRPTSSTYNNGIQWTIGLPTNYTMNGVTYNVTITNNTQQNPYFSVAARTNEVIVMRAYGSTFPGFSAQFGEASAIECGIATQNGSLVWGPFNRTLSLNHEITVLAAGGGYYVTHDKDFNIATVYDIYTGQQIGKPLQLPGSALSSLSRAGAIAYGKCYIWDFGGYVNAIDLKTAKLNWTYVPENAGYDTPYGVYPLWHFGTGSIADGKLFLSQGRMYDPPLFAGAKKLALNVTDGSVVWSILGTFAREPCAISDGYMVGYNSYDAQIYSFGKGPSQMTVNAPNVGIAPGQSVMISGTVLDKAAGTTDKDRSARFPTGVACVSDESQEAWMEYVYMQQPRPTNATGVTVELYVLDSNGNYRSIGTTTTDLNGVYSYNWMPDVEGKYSVYAVFSGSESYYPSQATTAFAVDPAQATPTPEPTQAPTMADLYFVPATAGLFIAIVVVGLLTIIVLRKRP